MIAAHLNPPDGDKPLYWDAPELYGEPEALNLMGTVAAPLLGGFSLASMALTVAVGGAAFIAQAVWIIGHFISPKRMARLLEL